MDDNTTPTDEEIFLTYSDFINTHLSRDGKYITVPIPRPGDFERFLKNLNILLRLSELDILTLTEKEQCYELTQKGRAMFAILIL